VVKLAELVGPSLAAGAGRVICRCNFCGKETRITTKVSQFAQLLSGPDRFYCTHCLRNRYNTKNGRNVLILTFRGIIGYYHHMFFAHQARQPLMYISEIQDHIGLHAQVGLSNPAFNYDPESYLWFVDFGRVGRGRSKVPVEAVLRTIQEQILAFNLYEVVKDIRPQKLFRRYEEAVLQFYHQRFRPDGNRILAPTLQKTGASDIPPEKLASAYTSVTTYSSNTTSDTKKRINWDDTRLFTPHQLV
jgi:hypothetical protein